MQNFDTTLESLVFDNKYVLRDHPLQFIFATSWNIDET